MNKTTNIESETQIAPKVFISYSWTTPEHVDRVLSWANQLISDGVQVTIDKYDLKEGQDKNSFMEKMVTDSTVTHVLVMCDKAYKEKADQRKAGVGTESEIISQEVYAKVNQNKFIPIICELSADNQPYLPVFFKSRIWLDFSSMEKVAENWERLIRLLFNKPLLEKPKLGKPPTYITTNEQNPAHTFLIKYQVFVNALTKESKNVKVSRDDFLSDLIRFADELRVRTAPNVANIGTKIIEDAGRLRVVRNQIVDWILFETKVTTEAEFSGILIAFLESLLTLKSRPNEVTTWTDSWFDAHVIFVYETFLYILAALLKNQCYIALREIFSTHYLLSEMELHHRQPFDSFDSFHGYSRAIESVMKSQHSQYYNCTAELLRRQADRTDLTFKAIIEAELLAFLMSCLREDTRWYPQTFYYSGYSDIYPFFLRCTQHKFAKNLATITGIEDSKDLKNAVATGAQRLDISRWFFHGNSLFAALNIEKIDTIN